jgi:hypothetical protein
MVPPLSEVDGCRLCHGRCVKACEEFQSLVTDGPHVVVLTDMMGDGRNLFYYKK